MTRKSKTLMLATAIAGIMLAAVVSGHAQQMVMSPDGDVAGIRGSLVERADP